MPELPEVEITTRKLGALLQGKHILNLDNKKILGVERRGKAVLIWLGGVLPQHQIFSRHAYSPAGELLCSRRRAAQGLAKTDADAKLYLLAFHQRMSGKLLVVERGVGDKHIRRRFRLSNGKDLVFHDVRKFGVIWYGKPEKIFKDMYFKTLGPDALEISFAGFKSILESDAKIKSFLLNQKKIAGVGNIMADEMLWRAMIHPERKTGKLGPREIKKLYASMKFVFKRSIRMGGSSMRDWLHPGGESGGYFKKRFVYGRAGEGCGRCGHRIIRKKIAGRSSFYCGVCQKS